MLKPKAQCFQRTAYAMFPKLIFFSQLCVQILHHQLENELKDHENKPITCQPDFLIEV